MGIFSNPLSYVGAGPGVTGTPTTQNSTVRAATVAEANAGTATDIYISPATDQAATLLDFASPPVGGFGSTTPRPVATTGITMSEGANIAVGTATGTKIGTATTQKLGFFNATPIVQPVTTTDIKVALVNLGLLASGASPLDLGSAALGSGTHTLSDGANIVVGSTTGTKIGTATTQKVGFFNATPIVQPAAATDIKVALVDLGLLASGASPLDLGSAALGSGTHTLADGANIVVGSTTGTIIGTATTQKLGFFNAAPVVQPANTSDIRTSLIDLGLLASGGANPLNLNGGAFTGASAALTSSGATIALAANSSGGSGVAGVFTSSAATVDAVQCAGGSIKVPAPSPASGASPITNNARTGQVSFTDVIGGGAYVTLTMANSFITASSVIIASASCATADTAIVIAQINPGASTVAFRSFNAGGSNTSDPIIINFWVLN